MFSQRRSLLGEYERTNVKNSAVKLLVIAGLIATLTACSSGNKESDETTKEAAPAVTVDETLKDQLTVGEGEAILPGTIESNRQDNLSAECETAVAPIREIMAKGNALSLGVADNDKASKLLSEAEALCGAQEYTDFFTKEYMGWFTSK
jgi:hypothetical protein